MSQHLQDYISSFEYAGSSDLFTDCRKTITEEIKINNILVKKFTNEFWTSKQRQSNSIHEISYRACFKSQLPNFFIETFTKPGDIIYDPFSGRGTTVIEAALLGRNIISNDINPISKILCKPRLFIPDMVSVEKRLSEITVQENIDDDIDLSMFFHRSTLNEIKSLRAYLWYQSENNLSDDVDAWIQMVATNRLTGHSKGFFSVYTLPPNQAVSPSRQIKINQQYNQRPEYKNVKSIILDKSQDLVKDISAERRRVLKNVGTKAVFLNNDARQTTTIKDNSVKLIVTSPPFLDVIQYAEDNWLRCWFNKIDSNILDKITVAKKIEDWSSVMYQVFNELYRILQDDGLLAFEVGEVKNGSIKLDEYVVELAMQSGFVCQGIMINSQNFTKTANIWGISNNDKGTNSNRIVLLTKISEYSIFV